MRSKSLYAGLLLRASLALAEAGVTYTSRLLDIHIAKQQLSDAYRQLNPHMTVPTLRGPGLLLTDSADIHNFSARQAGAGWMDADEELASAVEQVVVAHYAISIENLTLSKLLVNKPLLLPVVKRVLGGLSRSLEDRADQAPMVVHPCGPRPSRIGSGWQHLPMCRLAAPSNPCASRCTLTSVLCHHRGQGPDYSESASAGPTLW